ncbi:hypothetical protein [Flavobacterium sp. U410]
MSGIKIMRNPKAKNHQKTIQKPEKHGAKKHQVQHDQTPTDKIYQNLQIKSNTLKDTRLQIFAQKTSQNYACTTKAHSLKSLFAFYHKNLKKQNGYTLCVQSPQGYAHFFRRLATVTIF